MRGENIYKQLHKDSYKMCVTRLKDDNQISVFVAGYEVCAMIDTGLQFLLLVQICFRK